MTDDAQNLPAEEPGRPTNGRGLEVTASLPSLPGTATTSIEARGTESTEADATRGPASWRRAAMERPTKEVFGDYELLEELGKGGMGVVYRARQLSANRLVALKVIRPEHLLVVSDAERARQLARFRVEAQAAARLQHDHLVTVYDVGEIDGVCYYAMQLVEGASLRGLLDAGPMEARQAAYYIEQVARALAAAHDAGIIHRDIKPHNILVDVKRDRALLMDFGLAKLAEGDQQLTATEAVFGSPPYMSPEQTLHATDVTPASDIYSLGAALYHCLTGRPPFQAATSLDTILQIRSQEAVSAMHLNQGVPKDLDTVCKKCLEKEPGKRYRSAEELAEELRRFLAGEPIHARAIGPVERSWRWCKRNRVVASLLATISLVLVAGAITASVLAVIAQGHAAAAQQEAERANEQKKAADAATALAKDAEGKAERQAQEASRVATQKAEIAEAHRQRLVRLYVNHGTAELLRGEHVLSLPWLTEALHLDQGTPSERIHRLRLASLMRTVPRLEHLWVKPGFAYRVKRSRDEKYVFSAGGIPNGKTMLNGGAMVWNAATGDAVDLPHPMENVLEGTFSDDSKRLALLTDDGKVAVFDLESRQLVASGSSGTGSGTHEIAFLRDGESIVTAGYGGFVYRWRREDAKLRPTMIRTWSFANFMKIVVTPGDSPQFLTTTDPGVMFWDSQGEMFAAPYQAKSGAHLSHLSPDGKLLAIGGGMWSVIELTNPVKEVKVDQIGSPRGFFKDSRRLMVVQGKELRFVDVTKEQEISPKIESPLEILEVALSGNDKFVAIATRDQAVRIYEVTTARQRAILWHTAGVTQMRFNESGEQLVTGCMDGTVRLWKLPAPAADLESVATAGGKIRRFIVGNQGRKIAALVDTGRIRVWDLHSLEKPLAEFEQTDQILDAVFADDDRKLAAVTKEGSLFAIDTETGRSVAAGTKTYQTMTTIEEQVGHLLSIDDRLFSVCGILNSDSGTMTIQEWKLGPDTIELVKTDHSGGGPMAFAGSQKDRRIVLASGFRWQPHAQLIDLNVDTHKYSALMTFELAPTCLALHPTSRDIAICSKSMQTLNGQLQILRADDASSLAARMLATDAYSRVFYTPDGTRLIAVCGRQVQLRDSATGNLVAPPIVAKRINDLRCSQDSRLFAVAEGDTVSLWDCRTGQIAAVPFALKKSATTVAFVENDTKLWIGCDDGTILGARLESHAGSGEEARLFARLVSGHQVNEADSLSTLEAKDADQMWKQYVQLPSRWAD